MRPEHSKEYFLRVECKNFRHSFVDQKLHISVTDVPPTPTLTPSTLKVEEGTSVSLKCSAPAPCLSHPPALTWSSSLGHIQESLQENLDRTKVQTSVLTFTASRLHHGKEISCTAVYKKQDGSSQSNSTSLTADVSFAPQILSSYDCIQTADQLNCSCETVGNPPPALQWYLDGLPVNHSDRFAISSEPLNASGLSSSITVSQPQQRDLSTLLCNSSNSLGSTTQRFFVYNLKTHQDFLMLPVFITTFVVLFLVICGLLLVIRAQRTHQIVHKSQTLTSGEANEVPNVEEEAIYTNAKEVRQGEVANPAVISEPNSANLPSTGPNDAEGATESSEKKEGGGSDAIYCSVNWKTKSKKKKEEDAVDMGQPGSSYLEEERCAVGAMSSNLVSDALEMGNLYDEFEPRPENKAVECEYAQVKFKRKTVIRK
ncbi:cell adhesion molecule 4-like [Sparus aurata]|uniref:cell adhesion molecule 4-like n=1 Tax=Sparus aurata TaxID=8175 RepID=UPI0011C0D015|nr:cell adhesion molecule 4-like [Sparus aurata]